MINKYIALSGNNMLRIIFFVLALLAGQSSAVAMTGSIFTSEVILDNSSVNMEKKATQKAFIEVLVRVSGQANITQNPTIENALKSMDSYINKISYGKIRNSPSLILNFDENKIRNLLIQAQVSYWGTPRPEVLFWLVEDSQTHRRVIWEQSNAPLIRDIKNQGKRRGLPVLIPTGDFDDIISVSIPDLLGRFVSPISKASARYNPTGVVVVEWDKKRIKWRFYPNMATMASDIPIEGVADGSQIEMMSQLINDISDYYVANFSINLADGNSNSKVLEVSGLDSAEDFFELERILKQLDTVAALHLNSIHNDRAIFNVNLLAPERLFHNELNRSAHLQRADNQSMLVDMPTQEPVTKSKEISDEYRDVKDGQIDIIDIGTRALSFSQWRAKNKISVIDATPLNQDENRTKADLNYRWLH